jgi:hypothetical protein
MANSTQKPFQSPRFRVRFPAGGDPFEAMTVTVGPRLSATTTDSVPAKEICIIDDCTTASDSASLTVANINGENSNRFFRGQRVEVDESDPAVAGGAWCPMFTGRVIKENARSGPSGSEIAIDLMDLGWHLTTSKAVPLQNINGITLGVLLQKVVDPSWGFRSTILAGQPDVTIGNVLNRTLKQGRQGALRQYAPPKTILPYIQIEPGQTPWEILQTYLTRIGYLMNIGVRGDIILFRPDYSQPAPYETLHYYGTNSASSVLNNIVGTPTVISTIDGVFTETQCWSTVVKPTLVQDTEKSKDPNSQYRHYTYPAPVEVLPFVRREVFSDGEAISEEMRENRAIWKYQMGLFNSWSYECEVPAHSSNGVFYASDSMISVDDAFHGVSGTFYIQRVKKTYGEGGGSSHLLLRKPYLLDPSLQTQSGGGASRAAAAPKVVP